MTLSMLRKWLLLGLACCLGTLAVILLLVRLLMSQAEQLTPQIEALLEARIGAPVTIEGISLSLARSDPQLSLTGVSATTEAGERLFSLERLHLRLDSWASLSTRAPVFRNAYMRGFAVHFYQGSGMEWRWPRPASLPFELGADPTLDLETLDAWIGLLLQQHLQVEETRIVLHAREEKATLKAPSLVLTGDARRTRLEGQVTIDSGALDERADAPPAAHMRAEMQPGQQGLRDFSAALQLDMQLDHLSTLMEILRPVAAPQLADINGNVRLWGRWGEGVLQEARLSADIPELTLLQSHQLALLRNISAQGVWQRSGEGGQAWLSGDAESVEWASPEQVGNRPALPHHWYFSHQPGEWELRTSGFELASLAAWHRYIKLPESLTRVLNTLSPRGNVEGFSLGQKAGDWRVDAAVRDLKASPWGRAPGGGPFDAWVQARNQRGRVLFSDSGESSLEFPDLFAEPLTLDHAQGEVEWVYDGPVALVSGKQLEVEWNGASVTGNFGLVNAAGRGRFGLDLAFSDVDALNRPVQSWLPVSMMAPDLTEWLSRDISGYVERGALTVGVPFGAQIDDQTATAALDLTIEEGAIPIAPGWPMLTDIQGQLRWHSSEGVSATAEHAKSEGMTAKDAHITLQDELLRVDGDVEATGASLLRFLQAAPLISSNVLEQIEAQGRIDAALALTLPLGNPEALSVDIEATPKLSTLRYKPLDLPIRDIGGDIEWRQQGARADLLGNATGQLLGRELSATFQPDQNIAFTGIVGVRDLLALLGANSEALPLSGQASWQGQLDWGSDPHWHMQSDGRGVRVDLPSPWGKAEDERWPWTLSADLSRARIESELGEIAHLRAQAMGGTLAGAVNLGDAAANAPRWPEQPGWRVDALTDGLSGRLHYDNAARNPVDISVSQLNLDTLLAWAGQLQRISPSSVTDEPEGWMQSVKTRLPAPATFPAWLEKLPDGRLRVADIALGPERFGPLTAYWQSDSESLSLAPVGLTLGELSARGEMHWEGRPYINETRADITLLGGDVGTALERLNQPVALRSQRTNVAANLTWPGAPWQFSLSRANGDLALDLRDGRFVTLNSTPARLVGLLNLDNILRRLRLDFSDVTGEGTAFDLVQGQADVTGGQLLLRGPLEIEAPSSSIRLTGSVDLLQRELDQRLGVSLPISQSLPFAAIAAGAPVVGGALFLAHSLFGDTLSQATTIHYRVTGPWAAPNVTLEGSR
ncbi:YhdP family protein [Vreelandella massiliensis]|uniref:YhdP family phospholipid transporter n=1 Tax=Vreelandella massiliensis TaxID=1816686 RepID=UPI00096A7AF7|nr:AsmA-like C-terminal region-containing protein [Halomonas massiliensis]